MNSTDAETLLRCHRPGREPDGRTQKALRLADTDPELGRKLAEQTKFDAQIVEAIHYIIPPEDLRDKLSALSAAAAGPRRGWGAQLASPAVLAAAAGVLLFAGVIVFFVMESMTRFSGREAVEQMIDVTAKMNGSEFEAVATTTTQLGDWFYMRGYEGYEVPPEFAALPVVGSRVFKQDGKPVAQFVVERHDSVIFEFHAADFGVELPEDGGWQIFEQDRWVAAVRQRGGRCVMVAFRGSDADMRAFLDTLPKK